MRVVLQVHDELETEVPEVLADVVDGKVWEWMVGVAELLVPLLVNVGRSNNWDAVRRCCLNTSPS